RIGRPTFDTVVKLLEKNTIFRSKGRKPQRPVYWQFSCFLIRYGQYGSPMADTMLKTGVGYGTVVLYCRRVIRAFRELRATYAAWFTEAEQRESMSTIEEKTGFPDSIGSGDGSLVQTVKPSTVGTAYLSRKGFFAFGIFAIVNHGLWFGSWDLGCPGSVTDVRVFKNSHFWAHRNQYLTEGCYILVD
ncbi:hypothetical protein K438DRAFT_1483701, partial [Mycena galopus ATCC 62051]